MAGNSKICIRIQSQLILREFLYLMLCLWKEQLTISKKQYTKSRVQRSPWSVFRKPWFSHTFSVIRQYQNYNVWKNWGFLNTDHGRLCTPDLVYCFFELVSYSFQRESIKYMNSGRISWLWIPIQIFEFPTILPWLPMMQLWAWTPLWGTGSNPYVDAING